MKTDLTEYSDQELDMVVQNDEPLYNEFMRQVNRASYRNADKCFEEFEEFLREYFIFSQGQLDDLRESFDNELEEIVDDNEN